MTPPRPVANIAGEIARKLTAAQRRTMAGPIRHSYGDTMARVGTRATIIALNNRGLLDDIRFTSIGLAVREILTKEPDHGQ